MQALLEIIHYIIMLYASVAFLRFAAQWVNADYRNPMCMGIIQMTDPVLNPMRKIIPKWKGQDTAALVLVGLMVALDLGIKVLLSTSGASLPLVFVLWLMGTAQVILNTYLFILVIHAIGSWFIQDPYHPVMSFFATITEPLLRPLRAVIKPLGGFLDITPMIALMGIYFIQSQLPYLFNGLLKLLN